MAYNNFPYTDLNSLNLDWIIKKCKEAFSREIPTKTSQLENDSGFGTYTKPEGGIPKSDLSSAVQTSLDKADTAYQKPAGGIPETDLTAALQTLIRSLAANEFKPYPVSFAAGSPAVFSDGADDIPVKDLSVSIEPVQNGTGDPAPDNVRPISGWTGASITISPTADPADGTTYTIAFPATAGTVCGGTLDVTTGTLTVTFACVSKLWGDMTSEVVYTNTVKRNLSLTELGDGNNRPASRSNIAKYANNTQDNVHYQMFINGNGAAFYLPLNTPGNTVIQLLYPLAEPVIYHITPTEVKTLLGTNNIWADCGPVSAEYRADITLYIDRLTDPDHDMYADTQITSGSYFMVGNDLYYATTVIPAGDQIIPGTNCTKTNLAAALNALNT